MITLGVTQMNKRKHKRNKTLEGCGLNTPKDVLLIIFPYLHFTKLLFIYTHSILHNQHWYQLCLNTCLRTRCLYP